jgi:hypothetical protein|tara:strand:+ start:844 stop:1089 length:246 start_codon:yes stop_codon:yes gene_type:complete
MKNFFSNIAHLGFIGLYTFVYWSSGGLVSDYETDLGIFLIGFCLVCYVPYFIAQKHAENNYYKEQRTRINSKKKKKKKKKK